MIKNKIKAVFLDRDGVLNIDTGYPYRIDDLFLISGAGEALDFLRKKGYIIIVVTNQSGVARGIFSIEDVNIFHEALQKRLSLKNGKVDDFYICPYHPEAVVEQYRLDHFDRKPSPGMIERAIVDWSIDRSQSFLIGDKQTDIEAAQAAGIKGYLFAESDLYSFVTRIFASRAGSGD